MVKPKTLVIDNVLDPGFHPGIRFAANFRRYLDGEVVVRRGPECDYPKDPSEFSHIIVTGSRASCLDRSHWVENLTSYLQKVMELEIPLLGVCFGHQMIARSLGGLSTVRRSPTPEIGWIEIALKQSHPLFKGLPQRFYTYSFHFDEVFNLPKQLVCTASSNRCTVQAFFMKNKPVFGIQFHPEKSLQEAECGIDFYLKKYKNQFPDSLINGNRGEELFSEKTAQTVFKNFLNVTNANKK